MTTNRKSPDPSLPPSATPSQEESSEAPDEPTPEELARIRHITEIYRDVDHAAHLNDAPIVTEAMRVWERDEQDILAFLNNQTQDSTSDDLTEEEAEEIRRLSEHFRAQDLAALNKAAPVVAESMAIWERDEEKILAHLRDTLDPEGVKKPTR